MLSYSLVLSLGLLLSACGKRPVDGGLSQLPDVPATALTHAYTGDNTLQWTLCSDHPGADDAARLNERVQALGLGTASRVGERIEVNLVGVSSDYNHRSLLEEELFARGELRVGPPSNPNLTHAPRMGDPPELEELLVTERDVEGARIVQSSGNPPLLVEVSLSRSGRRKLKKWSTKEVGEKLLILFDGKFHSAPIVRSPLVSGRLLLVASNAHDARKVAASLRPPHLQGTWWHCPRDRK